MTHNVPVQSLIDHIKTAIDVDPWAKEMVENLLKEQEHKDRLYHALEEDWKRLKELLKEQEAVEPKTEPSAKGYWYTCGVCGWWLFEVRDTVHFDGRKRIRYCASCGQAVKWE